jgi:eukaryotic-like serine/threonine-protein kinase
MTTAPSPGSGSDAAHPRRIGRYEILDRIGAGSMGIVYLAQDPLIGRPVALKTLTPGKPMGDRDFEALRSRLLNEAASAGRLTHPGIVTVHDVVDGGDTGQICIAMEYVAGRSLKEHLHRREILSLQFTADVISQVATVLDFAHTRGVIHRDIKPANVMLTDNGQVKITDFGIASLHGQDLAHDLKSMGTPNYLAPERLLGFEADHRADVYSLGVVLYEMLTGHVPFQGESLAELARNTVEQPFTPPEIYRPDLLPGLRAILDRALAKEPDDRYPTAGDLASDLNAVVKAQARMSDTRPIDAALPQSAPAAPAGGGLARALAAAGSRVRSLSGRVRRSIQPPTLRPFLLAGAAAVLLAVLGLSAWLLLRPAPAPAAPSPAVADRRPAEAHEEIQQLQYLSLLRQVEARYRAGDSAGADALLAEADKLSPESGRIDRLRDEAHFDVEADQAVQRVAQVLQLLDAAEEALDHGGFATADAALYKVEEIDPGNEEAAALRQRLEGARQAAQLAQRRRTEEPVAEPVAAEPQFAPFTVTQVPAVAEPEPFGTLKVDFSSESPKGVLTIYEGDQQIVRREFSFFEKHGLFRRKATTGGFDLQRRLAAGDLHLRVYLSLPGHETVNRTVHAHLPGGALRVLTVRVSPEGEVETGFH